MTTAAGRNTSSHPPYSYNPCNDLVGEGCNYFNARWYDASTGRFITEDPARDGSNWYTYTYNNPLKYIDPTGLAAYDSAPSFSLSDEDKEEIRNELKEREGGDDGDRKSLGDKLREGWEKLKNAFDENNQRYREKRFREFLEQFPKEVVEQLTDLGVFEEDFTGVVYTGFGASAFMGLSASNEAGIAGFFENGKLVGSSEYQSIGFGLISDFGKNVYGIVGVMPNGTEDNLYGWAGATAYNRSFAPKLGLTSGVVTPSDTVTAYEFSISYGPSGLSRSASTTLTYTQEFNSQASSYYIPPQRGDN